MINNYQIYCPQKYNNIILIVHGMEETQDRYKDFATFLKNNNCLVVTYNLIGHEQENRGYFGKNGKELLINQLNDYVNLLTKKYKKDVTIIAHSMGTLIVRNYLQLNPKGIKKVILLGTPPPNKLASIGIIIANIIKIFKNEKEKSLFLEKLTFLNTYKYPNLSWISLNQKNILFYQNDPNCGFKFTINGYITLYKLVLGLMNNFNNKNKKLKINILVGEDDPIVGGKKGLEQTKKYLERQDFNEITIKSYDNLRHELLNELNKKEIYYDILNYIKENDG